MNETIKTLLNRRSCKSFSEKQISDEDLKIILEAGMFAPCGKGMQSPFMLVLQNEKDIKELSKLNAKVLGAEGIDPFYGAPTVICVFADKNIFTYIEDASLAIGNMLNAAHSLGIDSCWIHRCKEEFELEEGKVLKEKWNIDDNLVGIGHCILGYAKNGVIPAKARKENYFKIIK